MYSLISQHLEKVPAFVTVARLGSITKAAQALSISQAALSQTVKTLEGALDIELFIRSKTGVTLTSQGQELLTFGQKLIEEIDFLETKMRNPNSHSIERLRIGTHEALAINFWPEMLSKFKIKHPEIFPSLVSGRINLLLRQLGEGEIDAMVTVKPKASGSFSSLFLYRDTFNFYVSKESPLKLDGKALRLVKVEKDTLNRIPILTDRQAHLTANKPLSKVLVKNGLHSAQHFQLNSFQAAAQLAAQGLGLALLPTRVGNKVPSLRKILVEEVNEKEFEHDINLTTLKSGKSLGKVKRLTSLLQSHC